MARAGDDVTDKDVEPPREGVEDGNDDDFVGDTCDRVGPEGFLCTRPVEHDGDHAAWAGDPGEDGYLCRRWTKDGVMVR